MRVLFDTSVLITAVVTELPRHAPAFTCFKAFTGGEHEGCCTTHTLAECYATLTALPLSRRIRPAEAARLIDETIVERLVVFDLDTDAYRRSVRRVAELSLASGVIYDALHLAAAEHHRCVRLYTYNEKHFRRLVPDGVSVMAPPPLPEG